MRPRRALANLCRDIPSSHAIQRHGSDRGGHQGGGYKVEPDQGDPKSTVVAEFPVEGLRMRSEREVSVWEKAELAAFTSRWWADNAVSVTVTFKAEEADQSHRS
jgi:hypothetical protein